jgi:RNase P subunit RPR2
VTDVWYFFGPDDPVRCPNRLSDGRICNRAQDLVAPGTAVRVRLQERAAAAAPGSLLRVCRSCDARLEVNVAPTVTA